MGRNGYDVAGIVPAGSLRKFCKFCQNSVNYAIIGGIQKMYQLAQITISTHDGVFSDGDFVLILGIPF